MTTLILDGYIVKEKADDGKIFFYTSMPNYNGNEFYCNNDEERCYEIALPIKKFLNTDNPQRCRIKIELEK